MADKEKDNKSLMDSIKLILGKEDKLNDQLENGRGLERYTKDLLLLMSLVKDYYQGNYRNIPYKTISAAVVGLLYVINPIDLIPDFIPFIGQVDDALVLKFCLKLMEKDLLKYKTWKDEQTASNHKSLKPSNKKLEDKNKGTEKEEESKAEDDKVDTKKSS
ncbi:YkvA family protein [Psychrobacter glacincola]|uniref:YkvA family protein n=1 Tax=Psychrobacter glacincola TaxID=56810 RepID=A0ABW1W5V7_9GAMM|nr:YkvA family protein [Psychrobacter glacincola]